MRERHDALCASTKKNGSPLEREEREEADGADPTAGRSTRPKSKNLYSFVVSLLRLRKITEFNLPVIMWLLLRECVPLPEINIAYRHVVHTCRHVSHMTPA